MQVSAHLTLLSQVESKVVAAAGARTTPCAFLCRRRVHVSNVSFANSRARAHLHIEKHAQATLAKGVAFWSDFARGLQFAMGG
eukprot:6182219-Pleurochrysis_carterae.AAC.2